MLLEYLFADDTPAAPTEFALVRVSRRAMATTFEIALPAGSLPDPLAAAEDALDLIDSLEDQMTVYRDDSEVARLNETAHAGFVPVEPRLFELFERCAAWSLATGGAFDIATGALTKAWGFYKREGRVPPEPELVRAMRASGFRHVVLDAERRAVKFRVPGLELNLGAVGKGYALDRAAELLRAKWRVRSALLHAGGSSACAIGAPPGDSRGWPVRLLHPTDPTADAGTVFARDAGLGTSAATFQYFEYNGTKYGHVLDPRTGRPAFGTLSATALAPTAAEADALSTAAFVLGAAGAEPLARLRPQVGLVVLQESGPLAPRADAERASNAGELRTGAPRAEAPLAERADHSPDERPLRFNLAPEAYSPPVPHGPVHAN